MMREEGKAPNPNIQAPENNQISIIKLQKSAPSMAWLKMLLDECRRTRMRRLKAPRALPCQLGVESF
jgi:hypothetical protein